MNAASANSDSLQALNSKLSAFCVSQNRILDDEIIIISNGNAASGTFKSGKTIKQVIRVCSTLLNNRAKLVIDTINEMPFIFADDLKESLEDTLKGYFTDDLGGFQERVRAIVNKAGGAKLEETALDEIGENQRETLVNLIADVEQYLITLKHSKKSTSPSGKILFIEIGCLIVTAFLAGLWVADKNGNYEPYIVLLAVTASALEIWRRIKHDNAT